MWTHLCGLHRKRTVSSMFSKSQNSWFHTSWYYRLHGTCNHIAGLLYRVEYAVRTGLTSSASNQCKWDVPTNQKPGPGNPTPLVDFKLKKAHYFNHGVYPKISFGSGSSLLLKISYCQNQRRPMYFMPLNMAQEIKPETIVICSMHFNGNIYLHLYTFFIFLLH